MSRSSEIIIDAVRDAAARKWAFGLIATIAAITIAASALTAGRTAVAERSVLASVDAETSRVITVTPRADKTISASASQTLSTLDPVDWILTMTAAQDVHTRPLHQSAPMRSYFGDVPPLIVLDEGRWPSPGEAIIGISPTSPPLFTEPSGVVFDASGAPVSIVGSYRADGALSFLTGSILRRSPEPTVSHTVIVQAPTFQDVEPTANAVVAVSGLSEGDLEIQESTAVNDVRAVVAGTFGDYSRSLSLYLAGVSALLVAAVTYVAVSARYRDFGRRRALGASRRAIMLIVLLQSILAALAGVLVGTVVSVAAAQLALGEPVAPTFLAGISYLTVIACAVAALPAAMVAALRDPLRVLRVP